MVTPPSLPRLSVFIREHREDILAAWEAFARKLPATATMDVAALRDHANAMLDVIARDLETPETETQRQAKAQGGRDAPSQGPALTAASRHGFGRAASGFSVESMVAEFRALRASVIGLWMKLEGHAGPTELEELIRFNEAIDQSIAESLAQHSGEIEIARDRFLAVLGHDLRNPLGVILTGSRFLSDTAELTDAQRTVVAGLERSGRRMIELVRDLLDFALTRFGAEMPVKRAKMDVGSLVRDVVAEAVASSPDTPIDVATSGDVVGAWDGARLAQALSNLIGNAVEHGTPGAAVRVAVHGERPEEVRIVVSNTGRPIPREDIAGLFEPMKGASRERDDRRHLGLGLYIVAKIVEAHGGKIDVRSSEEEGTSFIMSLPRSPRAIERGATPAVAHAFGDRPRSASDATQ